jgi:hypothetical protein
MILLFEIKGEMQRIPRDAMAFDHRNANFEVSIIAQWTDPPEDASQIQWAREVWGGPSHSFRGRAMSIT